jgi:hypothetical protein
MRLTASTPRVCCSLSPETCIYHANYSHCHWAEKFAEAAFSPVIISTTLLYRLMFLHTLPLTYLTSYYTFTTNLHFINDFQSFISPHIPLAPVWFIRHFISLTYSALYYFDSHPIVTSVSASYTVPKFLPTALPFIYPFFQLSQDMIKKRLKWNWDESPHLIPFFCLFSLFLLSFQLSSTAQLCK